MFHYFLNLSEFLNTYPHIARKLGEDEKEILKKFIEGHIEMGELSIGRRLIGMDNITMGAQFWVTITMGPYFRLVENKCFYIVFSSEISCIIHLYHASYRNSCHFTIAWKNVL